MSDLKYQILSCEDEDDDGLIWVCQTCLKGSSGGSSLDELRKAIHELTCTVTELKSQLDEKNLLNDKFEQRVKEIINEEKEKDRRQANIIIHGLEEKWDDEHKQKLYDDEVVSDIISMTGDDDLKKNLPEVIRLGKRIQGKVRPVKLVPRAPTLNLRKKLFKLREEKKLDKFPLIKFVPDRTMKEREELKKLYEEVRQRREAGESVMINFKNMKVVSCESYRVSAEGPGVGASGNPRTPSPKGVN